MTDEEILEVANRIVARYGLVAEFLGDAKSVGVGGDQRTVTRVICLIGVYPGYDVLSLLSTEISNRTPINRVTFEIAKKDLNSLFWCVDHEGMVLKGGILLYIQDTAHFFTFLNFWYKITKYEPR